MKLLVCILALYLPNQVCADETTLLELLAKLKQAGPTEFKYEEFHRVSKGKLNETSKGYLLLGSDGSLVKLQLEPNRQITTINNQGIHTWNAANKQHKNVEIPDSQAPDQVINVLHCLLNGHAEKLQASHAFATTQKGSHWVVQLIPKSEVLTSEAPVIQISGDQDAKKRTLVLLNNHGASTESRLTRTSVAKGLDYSVQRLIAEATNQK